MLGHTQEGYRKTATAPLPPFPGLLDPQICHQSSISRIIWDEGEESYKLANGYGNYMTMSQKSRERNEAPIEDEALGPGSVVHVLIRIRSHQTITESSLLGMNNIWKTLAVLECPIVLSEEFLAVDDDDVCTALIIADKDILEFVQNSKNTIDADSDDEMK
ncbi:hypothetical protein TNCV_2672101 [Trichonephila clavipes]|nr:hypothetical protein TNCV_2672101 [Trichonephila clavipes]